MDENNHLILYSELASTEYLLKRFDEDILAVHRQMEVLKIIFENLKGSWLAISLAHKALKYEVKEEKY